MSTTKITVKGLGRELLREVCEQLPSAITKLDLDRYFDEIKNHSFANIIKPNSLYIFCDVPTIYVNKVKTINYECEFAETISPVFYEGSGLCNLFFSEEGDKVIVITINDRFSGVFFLSTRSFLLTDWTHYPEGVRVFELIWPKMIKDFNIVPLKKRKKAKKIEVTVGMDPEFEMIGSNGLVINAADHYCSGYFDTYEAGKVGLDGAGYQIEFRPSPGKPHEVVKNIKVLFKEFNKAYQNYHLGVKGDRYPLGGHIHIGVGKEFIPPADLLDMFDYFIGMHLLKHSGSARGSYKKMGTFREQPWGFEYRTPPSSYLLVPEITRIVLKIAKNITETFLNEKEISYNYPPQKEDYLKIAKLSESEYAKFIGFVKKFEYMPKIATAFWTNKKMPSEVKVIFRDDWNPIIKNKIRKLLNEEFKNSRKKITFPVILYGLREDRGSVATIKINSKFFKLLPETEQLPRGLKKDGLWIGLPFSLRNSNFEFEVIKKDLTMALKKEIIKARKLKEKQEKEML